jgi:hypothetical protein
VKKPRKTRVRAPRWLIAHFQEARAIRAYTMALARFRIAFGPKFEFTR